MYHFVLCFFIVSKSHIIMSLCFYIVLHAGENKQNRGSSAQFVIHNLHLSVEVYSMLVFWMLNWQIFCVTCFGGHAFRCTRSDICYLSLSEVDQYSHAVRERLDLAKAKGWIHRICRELGVLNHRFIWDSCQWRKEDEKSRLGNWPENQHIVLYWPF